MYLFHPANELTRSTTQYITTFVLYNHFVFAIDEDSFTASLFPTVEEIMRVCDTYVLWHKNNNRQDGG